jgi:hypothetical protein
MESITVNGRTYTLDTSKKLVLLPDGTAVEVYTAVPSNVPAVPAMPTPPRATDRSLLAVRNSRAAAESSGSEEERAHELHAHRSRPAAVSLAGTGEDDGMFAVEATRQLAGTKPKVHKTVWAAYEDMLRETALWNASARRDTLIPPAKVGFVVSLCEQRDGQYVPVVVGGTSYRRVDKPASMQDLSMRDLETQERYNVLVSCTCGKSKVCKSLKQAYERMFSHRHADTEHASQDSIAASMANFPAAQLAKELSVMENGVYRPVKLGMMTLRRVSDDL